MSLLNATHDPALRSWVESANAPDTDFPVQNLPHGVFRRAGRGEAWRGGVAIGDMIVDLAAALSAGLFSGPTEAAAQAAAADSLNALMALGAPAWSALRAELSQQLRAGSAAAGRLQACLVPQHAAELALPARIGDYTDFFTSLHHCLNAGRLFQPDRPLPPNFKWLPIGYHGRASSVVVSGTDFQRPWGQARAADAAAPLFAPSQRLDYELELGAYVGPGNRLGEPIAIDAAEAQLFGLCLLNDWSARDVQAWESQPLGPFLAKNFLTSVSPWVVTMEALEPFRTATPREPDDPPTLPSLTARGARSDGAFDIQLEAWLQPSGMKQAATRLSRTSYRHAYWTLAQMVAHHTEGGCNLRPGDLLGTGTQSGPNPGEEGCLLELTHGGSRPLPLAGGQARSFLADGDTVILRGRCERAGFVSLGFGECRGTVWPARAS